MNLTQQPFGAVRPGVPADLFTLTNDHGITMTITNYGGIIATLLTPDRHGQPGDIVLGFDSAGGIRPTQPVLRLSGGAFRQPHRGGQVHAQRQTLYARRQRWGQPSPRRQSRLRQEALGSRTVLDAQCGGAATHLSQRGRRGRLSRQPGCDRHLYAGQRERSDAGLSRQDRPDDHPQPHQPHLFQPGRSGQHPRPFHDAQCGQVHPRERAADPHRRVAPGRRDAVRLPHAASHRRAHRAGRRATQIRRRL